MDPKLFSVPCARFEKGRCGCVGAAVGTADIYARGMLAHVARMSGHEAQTRGALYYKAAAILAYITDVMFGRRKHACGSERVVHMRAYRGVLAGIGGAARRGVLAAGGGGVGSLVAPGVAGGGAAQAERGLRVSSLYASESTRKGACLCLI